MAHQPPLRPARYRVSAPRPRPPYPTAVLVSTGAVGLLLGVLLWVVVGRDVASRSRTVTHTVTVEDRAARGSRTTPRSAASPTTNRHATPPASGGASDGSASTGGELEGSPAAADAQQPQSSSTQGVCVKQPDGTYRNCSTGDLP